MQHKHFGFLLALLMAGCQPPAGQPHGHSHGHGHAHPHGAADPHAGEDDEHPTFPITVWTNGFEIFAEHEAAVAGEPVEFITHVSSLQTGEPRRAGAIKFLVTHADGASFEHLVARPSADGIYRPKINFPRAGEWTVVLRVIEPGSSVAVPLQTVRVFADHEGAHEATPPDEAAGIRFTKENQWKYPVLVRPVGTHRIAERLTVSGMIEERPGSRGAITTPISGRLLTVQSGQLPEIGQQLAANQVVGRIQPLFSEITARLVNARAQVEKAKIRFDDADKTFERIRTLAGSGAKSARDLQSAEKERNLAQSELHSAGALEQAYGLANQDLLTGGEREIPTLLLKAPIGGSVVKLSGIAVGEFVQEGTTIAWTLDASRFHLHVHVPVSLTSRLGEITGAEVSLAGNADKWIPVWNESTGRLVTIGSQVHEETQTATVMIESDNPGRLFRVGQLVTVRLLVGEARNVLAVPTSALIDEEALATVYVQVAGETFQKRIVKAGRNDGQWVEILSGIAEGDRVVTHNAYSIRLASVAGGALPHSHH